MSKEEKEQKQHKFDKYENPSLRKFEKEKAEYLAGKPFRMRWRTLLSYIVAIAVFIGAPFRSFIYNGVRTDIPLREFPIGELLLQWEVLLFLGFGFLLILLLITRMPRKIILEEDGFRFQRFLKKECNILYTDVISYTFYGRGTQGIVINTYNKKYSFHIDFRRFKFLQDELKLKVGKDKEAEQKLW